MRSYGSLVGLFLLLCTPVAAISAPNDAYCQRFLPQMAAEALYIATCPNDTSCLRPISTVDGKAVITDTKGQVRQLQPRTPYRFLYKTAPTDIKNSMVVIQLKHVGAAARPKPADVQLARAALNFACLGFKRNVYRQSWPANIDAEEALPSVGYDKYDQYHRYGATSRDEKKLLHDNFHTNYFDGNDCVSTLEPARRAQFLLFARKVEISRSGDFVYRLGASPNEAVADPASQRYERFKVILGNYQKESQASGCFSFSVRSEGTELEVGLSDLEEKARFGTIFDQHLIKTWTFPLK